MHVLRSVPIRLLLAVLILSSAAVTVVLGLGIAARLLGVPHDRFANLTQPFGLVSALVYASIMSVAALATLLLIGKLIERRPLAELGLAPSGMLSQTLGGFAAGVASVSLIAGVMALCGWYRIDGIVHISPASLSLLALGLFVFLGVAVFEELVFRALLQRILEDGLGTVPAIMISAAVFGLIHRLNPGSSWHAIPFIAVSAGGLLGLTYAWTRKIWAPAGLHWAWNFSEGVLWGFPVSGIETVRLVEASVRGPEVWTGGDFGPEAGLVCLLVTAPLIVTLAVLTFHEGNFRSPRSFNEREARRTREAIDQMQIGPYY